MKHNPGKRLMTIGLLLLAAALALTAYNVWDESRAERSALAAAEQLQQEPVVPLEEGEQPFYQLHPEVEMPTVEIDGHRYLGRVAIPAIGLELPVLSEWSSANGKIAPCRYEGSAYMGDLVIAGHNYRSHFGALKQVGVGEEVCFTDVDGNIFSYRVAAMEILDGAAVEEMSEGDWDLTLFTCTYGGQTRLTLRCMEE